MLLLLAFDTEQEKEKFRYLYDKYADHMLRVARHILSNGSDIEDIVHDAFLYVAKNLNKIDCSDHKKTKSFLTTITKNKAIDHLRRTAKEIPFADPDVTLLADTSWESKETLAQALLKLSSESRDILLLHFYYGFSYHEIAKLLNLSYRSINGKVYRAKTKLANILAGKEDKQ